MFLSQIIIDVNLLKNLPMDSVLLFIFSLFGEPEGIVVIAVTQVLVVVGTPNWTLCSAQMHCGEGSPLCQG